MRPTALITLALGYALLLACSPDRTPTEVLNAPGCEETCNTAWECGGVLENDLDACLTLCDEEDEEHGRYRVCIDTSACEDMADCKIYGPRSSEPPDDTDSE